MIRTCEGLNFLLVFNYLFLFLIFLVFCWCIMEGGEIISFGYYILLIIYTFTRSLKFLKDVILKDVNPKLEFVITILYVLRILNKWSYMNVDMQKLIGLCGVLVICQTTRECDMHISSIKKEVSLEGKMRNGRWNLKGGMRR